MRKYLHLYNREIDMDNQSMELSVRAENFRKVISETACSNANGDNINIEYATKLAMSWLFTQREHKNSVYVIGNGGSAAVASHAQIDFLNVAKLKVHVLHESSTITCMANDYGYENAFSRILETILLENDLLIAISSSGQSKNICNASITAKKMGIKVITLSGFKSNNQLRQLGDLNYWLNSIDYGFVEIGHQFILHNLSDRFGLMSKQANAEPTIETVLV